MRRDKIELSLFHSKASIGQKSRVYIKLIISKKFLILIFRHAIPVEIIWRRKIGNFLKRKKITVKLNCITANSKWYEYIPSNNLEKNHVNYDETFPWKIIHIHNNNDKEVELTL